MSGETWRREQGNALNITQGTQHCPTWMVVNNIFNLQNVTALLQTIPEMQPSLPVQLNPVPCYA